MARVGRNDPCPCGSGKKYKKCHADSEQGAPQPSGPSAVHQNDGRVVEEIMRWAGARFGEAFAPFQAFPYEFNPSGPDVDLFAPWSVYEYFIGDRRVIDAYLEEHTSSIAPSLRTWLGAQARAWLSVWEMLSVEPGVSVRARDMLTGEVRAIREARGSTQLQRGDALLARVVEERGAWVFCGVHPRRLGAQAAASFVASARSSLSEGGPLPEGPLPIQRLRRSDAAVTLIKLWQRTALAV